LRRDEKKETGIPEESDTRTKIALFTSQRGKIPPPFEILSSSLSGNLGRKRATRISAAKSRPGVSRGGPFAVFFPLFFFYARSIAGCGYGSPRLATATKNRSIAPAGVVHLFPTLHNISPWIDDFSRLPSVCLYLPLFLCNGTSLSAAISRFIDHQ